MAVTMAFLNMDDPSLDEPVSIILTKRQMMFVSFCFDVGITQTAEYTTIE